MGRRTVVVIINDDRESLGNLEEVLSSTGHEPVVVNDALSAVDVVVQKQPDAVLLELKMPRKNGFVIADEINRVLETRKVPIIAMSEYFKEEFRFLLTLCGIERHLKKPLNPLDVIWAIANVTGGRRSWDEEWRGQADQSGPMGQGERYDNKTQNGESA